MQTCRSINVHVVNQIYVEIENYMNVYGLHGKADLSMYIALAKKNCYKT